VKLSEVLVRVQSWCAVSQQRLNLGDASANASIDAQEQTRGFMRLCKERVEYLGAVEVQGWAAVGRWASAASGSEERGKTYQGPECRWWSRREEQLQRSIRLVAIMINRFRLGPLGGSDRMGGLIVIARMMEMMVEVG
jgi:hypothetical protein